MTETVNACPCGKYILTSEYDKCQLCQKMSKSTRTTDTSAKVDAEISSEATGVGFALWHMQYSLGKLNGCNHWDEIIIDSMKAYLREVIDYVQSPRSDTSGVELVSDNEVLQAMLPAVWTDENVPQLNEALQRLKRAGYGVVKMTKVSES